MRERESQRVRRARIRVRRARRRAALRRGFTSRERGFSMTQLIVTVAIIAVIAAFSVMGIASARTSMRVQQSAREFAAYVEKARADAIRRHATASVQIASAGATTYLVTMDFNLDGVVETRTVSLQSDSHINHTPVTLTFDWRGRLTGAGLSLSFEGPDGRYPVQLDVTGSGDVTIGEQKFLDAEVPTVTLNKILNGVDDTIGSIGTAPPPAPPPTTPPPTTPPPTTPPPTTPPPTTPPPTTPPPTTPPPTTPPPTTPPPTTPPPTTPPPTTPPPTAPPPSTPPATVSCSMSLDVTSATISACNKQGDNCGYAVVRATLTNPAAGATVSATSVPSNLGTWLYNSSNGVYTFVIYATNNTRTTNSVEFTGLGCGLPQTVTVTTN